MYFTVKSVGEDLGAGEYTGVSHIIQVCPLTYRCRT